MKPWSAAISALLLLVLALAQSPASTPSASPLLPIKKGLTMQATVWPSYESNWAGRFSCNNCNPFEGDIQCNRTLPLLCISSPRSIVRPYYNIAFKYSPFEQVDGGYYDGWTGGFLQVTLPVQGSSITSYKVGDALCKSYFGNNANFATFDSGFYMPFMNNDPVKTWSLWDWGKVARGQWNFWGYFNHHYRGRAWVWANKQPNGNCGN
jgi:hypothetical protein